MNPSTVTSFAPLTQIPFCMRAAGAEQDLLRVRRVADEPEEALLGAEDLHGLAIDAVADADRVAGAGLVDGLLDPREVAAALALADREGLVRALRLGPDRGRLLRLRIRLGARVGGREQMPPPGRRGGRRAWDAHGLVLSVRCRGIAAGDASTIVLALQVRSYLYARCRAHRNGPASRGLQADPCGDRRRDGPHRRPRGRRRRHPSPRGRRGRRRAVVDHLALQGQGRHPRGGAALDRGPRGREHPRDRRPARRRGARPLSVGGGARRLARRAAHGRARDGRGALPPAGRAARNGAGERGAPRMGRGTARGGRRACSSARRRRRRSSTCG